MSVETISPVLPGLRQIYANDEGDLIATVLTSTSIAEVGVALGLLEDHHPYKLLVAAICLREIFDELPACPFAMGVEIETLGRAAALRHDRGAWVFEGIDSSGPYEIALLADGNLCYDLTVTIDGHSTFVKPGPITTDTISMGMLDLFMTRENLLREVIALIRATGVVFNPHIWFTLEEWRVENAAAAIEDIWSVL